MARASPLSSLARLAGVMSETGRGYAVVGGLAVSVRSEVRFTRDVVPVARVEEILAMKVLASVDERPQDRADVLALLEFNPRFDEQEVRELLALIEHRGFAREQDLVAKFEAMVAARG